MQTSMEELSSSVRALLARVDGAEQAWRDGVNNLQAANWLGGRTYDHDAAARRERAQLRGDR
jgi:hypothetical protein